MSPLNKRKLNKVRQKLDKVDDRLIKLIKIRTNLVKQVLKLNEPERSHFLALFPEQNLRNGG